MKCPYSIMNDILFMDRLAVAERKERIYGYIY